MRSQEPSTADCAATRDQSLAPREGGYFRKLPVVVEAWQWTKHGLGSAPDWLTRRERVFFGVGDPGTVSRSDDRLFISTLEGVMIACPGDWIIKGVIGEVYPCKADIFALTYEPAASALSRHVPTPDDAFGLNPKETAP